MKKLIILDRDGVINYDSDAYIKSPEEWHAIPNSLQAIADLNRAGYTVAIATNQSGIARGFYDQSVLNAIHEKMVAQLTALGGEIDKIVFCPHGPWDSCQCRKPKPGLFQQIQQAYQQPLLGVPAIGDSLRDLQAAIQFGCKPILVRTGKGERTLVREANTLNAIKPTVYNDLFAAATAIIREQA